MAFLYANVVRLCTQQKVRLSECRQDVITGLEECLHLNSPNEFNLLWVFFYFVCLFCLFYFAYLLLTPLGPNPGILFRPLKKDCFFFLLSVWPYKQVVFKVLTSSERHTFIKAVQSN